MTSKNSVLTLMAQIFLSYARKDGKAAAMRLRGELERVGFEVWRDIEDMQGGQAWKEQLRQAIRRVDVVLVLMTPAAVNSKYVEWEWDTAFTVGTQVIPLLIEKCAVPGELGNLHYHNLSTDQEYSLGLASLVRDLIQVNSSTSSEKEFEIPSQPMPSDRGSRGVSIGGNADGANIVTGDRNVVGNNNSVTHQSGGKYQIKIDKAENTRIGDDYRN